MKVHRPRCARPLYAQSSEYASSIVDFGAYVRSFRDVLLPGCFTPNISIRFLLRFVISRIFHSSMHPTAYVLSNDCDLSSTDDYDFCRARSSSKIFTSCQTRVTRVFLKARSSPIQHFYLLLCASTQQLYLGPVQLRDRPCMLFLNDPSLPRPQLL